MKRYISLLLFFLLLLDHVPSMAVLEGAEKPVVAIRAIRIPPYEEALLGFTGACGCLVTDFIINEQEGIDVARSVRRLRPRLIVAIGLEALLAVKGIADVPIVYLMVLDPEANLSGERNVTGVSLGVPPAKQLSWIKKVLPAARRVGVLYNPLKIGRLVKEARTASRALNLELIAKEIGNPKEVPARLQEMRNEVDLLWMLPDTTVLTAETVEAMLLFSIENRLPLVAFSPRYVDLGALCSIDVNIRDCGAQAGEMAARLLAGTPIENVPHTTPRRAVLTVHLRTAAKMGLVLGNEVLNDPTTITIP